MEIKTNIDKGDVSIKRDDAKPSPEGIVTREPEKDLVTRVSEVKVEDKPKETDATFNVNDIEKIEDPKAKEYAQQAYKSLQGDYTRKYQALAEERKSWEATKAESGNWTQDKVQTLLNDPKFVEAAKNVVNQQATDEDSALSEPEKKRIADNEKQIRLIVQQNTQLLKQQQDEANKAKYANYNPEAVDILTADLIANKVQATREHLHKVLDYEPAIIRAYELGKQDKKLENQEKLTSLSPEGTVAVGDNTIKPEKDESSRSLWNRIITKRLVEKAESGQIRK